MVVVVVDEREGGVVVETEMMGGEAWRWEERSRCGGRREWTGGGAEGESPWPRLEHGWKWWWSLGEVD